MATKSEISKSIMDSVKIMCDDVSNLISEFSENIPFGELDIEKNIYYKDIKDDEYNFTKSLIEALWKNQSWVINEKREFESKYFSIRSITQVYFSQTGENDELPWYIVGKFDDYYFLSEARCDYTGWDCQAWGSIVWAKSWSNLYQYGLIDKVREKIDNI